MENQITVCAGHHWAIHAGFIEVEGTAAAGLTWRLGLRNGGSALFTIGPGEVIVKTGDLSTAVS
jgi:hypothetical protein